MERSSETGDFAADVLTGLSASPKFLASKYFYDDEGARLFRRITELPEYYLTRCEAEIFRTRTAEIVESIAGGSRDVELIELGAGDGSKTAVLVSGFLENGYGVTYTPIDISAAAVAVLTGDFRRRFPGLTVNETVGDYFRVLDSLGDGNGRRKVVMFLGSNIGNFGNDESLEFFRRIAGSLAAGDRMFVGFDLKKDPRTILAAYDDPAGVTAEFNLNLLRRINRELGGRFDLAKFSHYATYGPTEGAARSFLISRVVQTVEIAALGRSFEFRAWEPVFTEISRKYDLGTIDDLARSTGFRVGRNFLDSRGYFADSVWERV